MHSRSLLLIPVAVLLGPAACRDSPTGLAKHNTGPQTLTREQLLNDPLTVLLVHLLPSQARNAPGGTALGLRADVDVAPVVPVDPGDSLVVAATVDLIIEAAEALPSANAGH